MKQRDETLQYVEQEVESVKKMFERKEISLCEDYEAKLTQKDQRITELEQEMNSKSEELEAMTQQAQQVPS